MVSCKIVTITIIYRGLRQRINENNLERDGGLHRGQS